MCRGGYNTIQLHVDNYGIDINTYGEATYEVYM